ncbi:hypothetical protein BDV32DRAFT_147598 [Aspergillus pseudonomiae]|uniref:Uncharacterized protein n=1 Tax=Aspergillus pseudonomiae TaxID=1506151 RepID=A0A5N6I6S6_9EURO|nr:uncharacterized protein BDV37DRAFT_280350 [Aspergillus pseudonomiae]KAB8262306.1 hypothetical protein BDV32DRAFT_147598 [Aspergillus pseudonomiae]KAE8407084.1 hypothetical protein BDV37DRAFT_280350 [Aspergillus pseudonomiae]
MAKVLGLASPFKTPTKTKNGFDKANAIDERPGSAPSGNITEMLDVTNSSKRSPSSIAAIRSVRSEEKFHTPERQCEAFYAHEKPEMSGARRDDFRNTEPMCRTVHSEDTSPLVRKALRQRNPSDRGLVSKVKRKLKFAVGPSRKKRLLASKKAGRRKSPTTSTTNWWNI